MNVHETTGIRELTAQELDEVNGGMGLPADPFVGFVITGCALILAGAVESLFDWLFGE